VNLSDATVVFLSLAIVFLVIVAIAAVVVAAQQRYDNAKTRELFYRLATLSTRAQLCAVRGDRDGVQQTLDRIIRLDPNVEPRKPIPRQQTPAGRRVN
jgi:hypothetical protein